MSGRTLHEYFAQAEALFASGEHEEACRQTGLELCRMAAGLATGLMSNSPGRQRAELEAAKEIANERERLVHTDGEVDRTLLSAPPDVATLALRVVAVENQVGDIQAFLHQLTLIDDGGEGGDAEANQDG